MHRSYLFIPGNNPAMLQNADIFGADAVIFDLEDAVSITEKDSARQLLKAYFETLSNPGYSIYVRINALTSSLGVTDISMVMNEIVEGIVLPKATVQDIKMLSKLLDTFENARRIKKKTVIIPIIETAKAVFEIGQIAQLPRVSALLLGAEDLTKDMEIERTKGGLEIQYPRAKIAFACKAFEIEAIDTPFTDVADDEGLEADTLFAKSMGMNAKSAIHPNQLETINRLFTPTDSQITEALRIVKADKEAQKVHRGVFSLDGKMIDKPVVERAEKLLVKAKLYGLLGDTDEK